MVQDDRHESLSGLQRQEIFRALVDAQDGGMSVAESRRAIAHRFAISETQLQRIEFEGLEDNWPPL